MTSNHSSDSGPHLIRQPLLLYLCSIVFTILYILFIIGEGISFDTLNVETTSVFLLFFYFVVAFILSWSREKTAGYMFISWYVIMMGLAIYVWSEAGMVIIMGFPVLPIGAFYLRYAAIKDQDPPPEEYVLWKLVLRVLMLGYAVIYIGGLPDFYAEWSASEAISNPIIPMLILGVVFIAALVLSWKSELIAGVLFIAWYVGILIFISLSPGLTRDVGPIRLFGFPILVHGILYLVYWFQIRPKNNPA